MAMLPPVAVTGVLSGEGDTIGLLKSQAHDNYFDGGDWSIPI